MSVENLYRSLQEVMEILSGTGEITLLTYLEESARKTVLLGAASEFEHDLCQLVRHFSAKMSGDSEHLVALIEQKAINRQYHTWFNWKDGSASTFFSLFGANFSDHMKKMKKDDAGFSAATDAFLEIGQTRNLLVHSNFSAYYIEKTAAEIFETYRLGRGFIERVSQEFQQAVEARERALRHAQPAR